MNTAMGNFFHWLLRASWQAAILVLLILAVQWVFGKKLGARWRHALWLLVLVRLALPFSPASAFSLFNYARLDNVVPAPVPAAAPIALAPVPVRQAPIPAINVPSGPLDLGYYDAPQTSLAPVEPARSSSATVNWFHKVNIPMLCAWLWAAGVVLLLARIIGQNVFFIRGLRSARLIGDGETLGLFVRCQAVLGVRGKIRLAETGRIKSPALYGLVRPRLLLPAGMIGRFSLEELRHIFLHELAHVKRRDMAVHYAATAFQVLHWFNPVLWFGFRRLAADREVACDELALAHAGNRASRSYGETIIKLLELCARPATAPGLLGILEDKNQMTRRIAMIAGFKRHSRWSLSAIALLLVLGVAGLTDATPRLNAAKPADTAINAPLAGMVATNVLPAGNMAKTFHQTIYAPADESQLQEDITAESAIIDKDRQKLLIKEARITTTDKNGNVQIVVESPELMFDGASGEMSSSNLVKLRTGDNRFSVSGEGFNWRKTNSSFVFSNLVHAVFKIPSGTNSQVPTPSVINADRCEYSPAKGDKLELMAFFGNVQMTTATGTLRTDKMQLTGRGTTSPDLESSGGVFMMVYDPMPNGIPSGRIPQPSQPLPGGSAAVAPKPAPIAKEDGFIRGTVLLPNGKPAANAQVALKKSKKPLNFRNGRLAGYPNDTIVETDATGHFSLPTDSNAVALFIIHEAGYARIPVKDLNPVLADVMEVGGGVKGAEHVGADLASRDPWSNPYIISLAYKLEAYGSIEGTMRVGSRPVTNQTVRLFDFNASSHEELTYDFREFNATTDDQGRFTINHVPPGERTIGRVTAEGDGSFKTEYAAGALVKPGEVAHIAVGGSGRPVTGKLVLNRPEVKADWSRAQVRLYTEPPVEFRISTMMWGWLNADRVNRHSFILNSAPDGSFCINDVPAGIYELSASVTEPTGWSPQSSGPPPFDTIGSVVQEVVVPEMAGGRSDEPLNLGSVTLAAYHKPVVGEVAALFETKTIDGLPLKLADYRGKYVLLDLGYYLRTNEPPEIRSLSRTWGGDDRLVIITLFSDVLPPSQFALTGTGAHWTQGELGDSLRTSWLKDYNAYWYFTTWGTSRGGGSGTVTSLPVSYLIGPDGKFLAVNLTGDDITKAVTKALGKPK